MSLRDNFYYMIGIVFLALAKGRNILRGYSTPKPFDYSDVSRCVQYDINVVDHWLSHLRDYTPGADSLVGMNVLELGPGSDLGIGLYLLARGCARYNAIDVHDLMGFTPDRFYDQLFEQIGCLAPNVDMDCLKEQLRKAKAETPSRLNYLVRDDFDIISALGESTVDLVFSQAAFEHFDDIEAVVAQLSAVCKSGAILIAEIDLKTHTRWIRDKDPNNIYRYSDWVYDLFRFRGIPNRVRPFQYKEVFQRYGWTNIAIVPLRKLNDPERNYAGLDKAFADENNQMDCLSIVFCARKSGKD